MLIFTSNVHSKDLHILLLRYSKQQKFQRNVNLLQTGHGKWKLPKLEITEIFG